MSEVADNPDAGRFELALDGKKAVAEYRLEGDTLTFTHTRVPPGREGEGIGERLARGALDQARERGLEVVPRCRFIASVIERHPEYRDLVRQGG